jgi:hypothetical protein
MVGATSTVGAADDRAAPAPGALAVAHTYSNETATTIATNRLINGTA